MLHPRFKLLPVALSILMLVCIQVEAVFRPVPEDAAPYHAQIDAVSKTLPRRFGSWVGTDVENEPSAIKLLNPNVIFTRRFTSQLPPYEQVTFMLVQCKDAREIAGHYPRNCYRASGMKIMSATPFDWEVDGVVFAGTEYEFKGADVVRQEWLRRGDLIVDNFILMPDTPIARDMDEVERRAWDYLKRFHGAAQVQVVFSRQGAAMDPEYRKRVFTEMVSAHMPIIDAIWKGSVKR